MRVIDVKSFDIPSDENDYDELVAFADTMACIPQFDAVPVEILDKIRAEIKSIEHYGTNNGTDFWLKTPDEIKKDVLMIIDKYRAEIDPQESEDI